MDEEFCSVVSDDGVVAAVFEADQETAYFYLVDTTAPEGWQIIHAHPVPARRQGERAASVRWSTDGDLAAVFRGDRIVAILDLQEASKDRKRAGRDVRAEDTMRFGRVH